MISSGVSRKVVSLLLVKRRNTCNLIKRTRIYGLITRGRMGVCVEFPWETVWIAHKRTHRSAHKMRSAPSLPQTRPLLQESDQP